MATRRLWWRSGASRGPRSTSDRGDRRRSDVDQRDRTLRRAVVFDRGRPAHPDAGDARWLRACLWPDQPERVARLEAEMALAATAPPLLLQGDAVEVMPDAFARVPADALPVVTTTWA